MKKFFRLFIILFIILAVLLTGGYVYLVVKGKDMIVSRLEKQLGKKVSFNSVSVAYPLTIKIDGITVEDYGTVKRGLFSLSLPYLLFKEIHFSRIEIIEPNIVIRSKKGEKIILPFLASPQPSDAAPAEPIAPLAPSPEVSTKKEQGQKFDFFARKIFFRWANLTAIETADDGEKTIFSLKDANLEIYHIAFPLKRSIKTDFNIVGTLSGFDGRLTDEKLTAQGWADLYQKDMKAKLRLLRKDEKISLDADIVSLKNDMTVKGMMSLGFHRKSREEGKKAKTFEDFFMKTLESSGMDVSLKFSFKTKMDKFDVGEISISGEVKKSE